MVHDTQLDLRDIAGLRHKQSRMLVLRAIRSVRALVVRLV